MKSGHWQTSSEQDDRGSNANHLVAFNTWGFERGVAGSLDALIRFNDVDADLDGQARVQGGTVDLGADESDGTQWSVPAPVIHVSPSGDDIDGLTWATAKRTVTGGIVGAAAHGGEVWVAQATYTEHIRLPAFVYLYGGFAGTESSRESRNAAAHPTILDGGGVPTVVYVRNAGCRFSALDGFVVQNGGFYTAGTTNGLLGKLAGRGGGIYCRVASPIIANNVVRTVS